jgi:hypothetical protein
MFNVDMAAIDAGENELMYDMVAPVWMRESEPPPSVSWLNDCQWGFLG